MNDDEILGAFSDEESVLAQHDDHFRRMLDDIPNTEWSLGSFEDESYRRLPDDLSTYSLKRPRATQKWGYEKRQTAPTVSEEHAR